MDIRNSVGKKLGDRPQMGRWSFLSLKKATKNSIVGIAFSLFGKQLNCWVCYGFGPNEMQILYRPELNNQKVVKNFYGCVKGPMSSCLWKGALGFLSKSFFAMAQSAVHRKGPYWKIVEQAAPFSQRVICL